MGNRHARRFAAGAAAIAVVASGFGTATSSSAARSDDRPVFHRGTKPIFREGAEEGGSGGSFALGRNLAGDVALDPLRAGQLRAAAADQAIAERRQGLHADTRSSVSGAWFPAGPNPIVQVASSESGLRAVSGRVGALAIRPSNHQIILGAAQGGIWTYDETTHQWTARGDGLPSLSIGAVAIAPSNDRVVYAGSGEGALSGDSQAGDGIDRSGDGGITWSHVSGDYFVAVSVSALAVDPTNPSHLYASVLRGRAGTRRVTPPNHSRFGLWESHDFGVTWTLIKAAPAGTDGATGVAIDPIEPRTVYAAFWGDAIYKSTDGGAHFSKIMHGLPEADYAGARTRFGFTVVHPRRDAKATLYTGFTWSDASGDHPAMVFKSVDGGANWHMLPGGSGVESVVDYCAEQCDYDNVLVADPRNPNVVYVAGQFGYSIGSGGIFRSDDGGQTWKNLGWNQHPDFHAVALDPTNPDHVAIGSDGGVWYSTTRGGRLTGAEPLAAVTWKDLNGTVDWSTGAVTGKSNLEITQYDSIANVPTVPDRVWGGTQDNGTVRKSAVSDTAYDVAGGDGGQVLVDPTDENYVYGTYYGISPYRYTDGGGSFFSNQYIENGINLNDRSEFYIPFVMNPHDANQLFLGTYRLYRTDNAKAAQSADVQWTPISGDLTTGCTGPAPNGGRGCYITAIGVGGGEAVYTGSQEGLVYRAADGQHGASPHWTRVGAGIFPNRPVADIKVDPSNDRVAYVAFNGFDAATPRHPGHVFKTTDGGVTWTDVSGDLPDTPVNSLVVDPAFSSTMYAGTVVGPFVTTDGGAHWTPLGTAMPVVAVEQLDFDPLHRTLSAGTHGRGAWRLHDSHAAAALRVNLTDAGIPVGAGTNLDYTIRVDNAGNANAHGVTISDPVPAHTTVVQADLGGTVHAGVVRWNGLTVPAGGTVTVHLRVRIAASLPASVTAIRNVGVRVTATGAQTAMGSAHVTPIAPPFGATVAPASATDGARPGDHATFPLTITNRGYTADSYSVSGTGAAAVTVYDSTCATPEPTTPVVAPGSTTSICVAVTVPAGASDNEHDTATVTVRSVGRPSVATTASLTTIAVLRDTLLVDEDGNGPDVQSYYADALTAAGAHFDTWDLASQSALPTGYLTAHRNVVWFTGNTYPGPLLAYESELTTFLRGGGRLFLSGQDVLDQAAGTTTFVHDYLHVNWDGTDVQNDKPTVAVTGATGNPVTNGIGAVTLDHTVLDAAFEDQITPIDPAQAAFTDDSGATDGLTFADSTYKVVFLSFPFEAYGSAAAKADLMGRVLSYFG